MNRSIFNLLLIILFLPFLQKITKLVNVKPLNGDFVAVKNPYYSSKAWYDGTYQVQCEKYLNEETGFRNILIRLNNQLDYSLFDLANAEGVVVGKENYLFEKDYIRAYLGGDFNGKELMDKKLRRFKFVQECLKAKGKNLVLVFEPGKASFYPEYIPDQYLKKYPKTLSNYEYLNKRAKELDINYLDFNKWFVQMKGSSRYPLMPKTGVHWSEYGAGLAADSLLKYLEKLRNIRLPSMEVRKLEVSKDARITDNDAEKAMNMLWNMPHPEMAYPQFGFVEKPGDSKISVLTVGDSYYWNIFNFRLPKYCFKNEAFWYFNATVYPDTYYGNKFASELDIKAETDKQDVIFLMVTERFLYKFDWGFIDRLYEMFAPELEKDYTYNQEFSIRGSSEWFDMIEHKAVMKDIPISDAVTMDVKFMLFQQNKEEFYLQYGLESYIWLIESDKAWVARLKEIADKQGVSVKEIIEKEADNSFRKDNPKSWEQYHKLADMQNLLRKDPAVMREVVGNKYYLRPDDMLWQEARARLKGGHLLASTM